MRRGRRYRWTSVCPRPVSDDVTEAYEAGVRVGREQAEASYRITLRAAAEVAEEALREAHPDIDPWLMGLGYDLDDEEDES
ncbi:MAG TPA: hypothetical protein VFB74_15170 [Kribbellaceae bacterium]|nr:hypothetical protein [Kribbellaceae bacterium]